QTNHNSSENWDFDLFDQQNFNQSSDQNLNLINSNSQSTSNKIEINSSDSFNNHLNHSLLGNEFGPSHAPSEKIIKIDHSSNHHENLDSINQIQSKKINHNHNHDQIKNQKSNPPSPPPHLLGHLVEIGFSPSQSRQALLETKPHSINHWDLSAALDRLLCQSSQNQNHLDPFNHQSQSIPSLGSTSSNSRITCENDISKSESPILLAGLNTKELQDQATELLAQASAYGTTALGKAASFWKQSKASLTKVIEDQTTSNSSNPFKDNEPSIKPKWMRDLRSTCSFDDRLAKSKDSDSSVQLPQRININSTSQSSHSFTSDITKPYASSARRKVPERIKNDENSKLNPSTLNSQSPIDFFSNDINRKSSSPVLTKNKSLSQSNLASSFIFHSIPLVTATQNQIHQLESYRLEGNDFFKKGQYANAEETYSKALNVFEDFSNEISLEKVYLGCLPLYNNRASARLKIGNGKGAQEDVEIVIKVLLGEDFELSKHSDYLIRRLESNQSRIPDQLKNKIDLSHQLGKALSKRAKIKEDSEKWQGAKLDWMNCRNLGLGVINGAGGIKIVNEGVARCLQALGINSKRNIKSSNSQTILNRPSSLVQRSMSKSVVTDAVQKLRQANEQAELEANEKLQSKDMVDAKISNWKSGKETNLRALIASLDLVLWPELGWKKVGMGELLTDSQVKMKYVRAISKVHPDKIPNESSLIEKMIAKSVFATLNEAWNATQQN
ncbi:hypothetical protein O181_090264, partial [Austropuccinia psidii MF-1]|nr:hypothetical protein [Austropuccinia psidii MF-1]